MSDGTFINIGGNLDDVQEEKAVPNGEYELEVVSVQDPKKAKESDRMVMPVFHRILDPDYPDAKLVAHYVTFPQESDFDENDGRTAQLLLRGVKRYLACFGVEWEGKGFDRGDLEGAVGKCFLKQEEYNDEVSNKLQLPRMKE